jgi:inorganic pyrophosphatase
MSDENGPDAKIISVACGDPAWERIVDLGGLPPFLTSEIAHFFDVYKDLEPGKITEVKGFDGVDAAWDEIDRSSERARAIADQS